MGDDRAHLRVSASVEPGGYFRRECPNCSLEYKTKEPEIERQDSLAEWMRLTIAEHGIQGVELEQRQPRPLCCPHCGVCSPSPDTLPRTLQDYLRRIVIREIVEPMIQRTIGRSLESLGRVGSRSRGFGVSITVDRSQWRTQRPIQSPEPNDGWRIRCIACGGQFKLVQRPWNRVHCPYCASELQVT